MARPIIDGEEWIVRRLEFLRSRLDQDPVEKERLAITAEIEALGRERGLTRAGRRVPRLLRPFRRRGHGT